MKYKALVWYKEGDETVKKDICGDFFNMGDACDWVSVLSKEREVIESHIYQEI